MAKHEHELAFADGSEVANARAVQTVLVHPLELRVDVFLGHPDRQVGPVHDVGGVGLAPVSKTSPKTAGISSFIGLGRTRAHRVPERPSSIRAISNELRLDDLVANRTMSRDIAETLRGIARGKRSFIVLAVPRLAGKSTVLRAILAERPTPSPVMTLAEDGEEIDQLVKKSAGGYLVIPEITQSAAMPGYIWGAAVRRIFKAAKGISLAATLHADGPDDAFAQICQGCGVPDADAKKIEFAVHLRSLGRWEEPTRRVVQSVHAIEGVDGGKPQPKLLHRWDEQHDRFI